MKHKIRDKSMFASYTYKTIKYMGCDPDYIKCTLSSHEKEVLKNNVQTNSYLHCNGKIILMKTSEKTKKTKKNKKNKNILDEPIHIIFSTFRYIDETILEYEGINPLEKLVKLNKDELIHNIHKNYGIIKGNHIKSWVFSYIDTVLYGFNVFALTSQLNDDVLRQIRKYL